MQSTLELPIWNNPFILQTTRFSELFRPIFLFINHDFRWSHSNHVAERNNPYIALSYYVKGPGKSCRRFETNEFHFTKTKIV